MRKAKVIELPAQERERLEQFVKSGKALARHLQHAQVLLKLDEGWLDKQIAQAFNLSTRTIIRLRQRYLAEGLEAVLSDKPRSGAPKKLDGQLQALVVATACSTPPAGHERWNLRLLADKMVELELVEDISHTTIARILKKTN